MANESNNFAELIAHCKEYGYIFQSSEIYDGLAAVYDYGQNGAQLKKNIRDYWWKSMTQLHDNIVGIDAAIFMHPTTWKASGHVDNFSDPMIDNKDSNKRYRVDHLIEAHAEALALEGKKEEEFALLKNMDALIAASDYAGLKQLIVDNNIKCAISKTCNWTDVREFNLMFSTQIGSVAEESDTIYLRPETAQGIFVNFLNVQKTGRMKIPFGIAQTGKAFRNEIVARQFIFRMREFEQMEMQFFVRPGTQMEWYNFWKEERKKWHESLGIPPEKLRYHDHIKLAHYADAALDIEFEFPFGWKELEGIHSRTDFDLTQHQTYSKKKIQYFDNELKEDGKPYGNYIPYVVETSVGLDRLFLTVMSLAYANEKWTKEDGTEDSRVVLRIPAKIAPTKLAILPLLKKDGLPEIAKQLMDDCKGSFMCFYEEKDAIGKRYRRMDAIGTPFCVTIDHQTKEDNTVTIRYRDTMVQERIALADVKHLILGKIN
ncbi:glycine--tRNA ligase [Ferruginibacter paludis]|uniref:glycine--tRNA ligase n=1 Tax=Ferruginibacter paludis TaxID=1310417 RepID=UPI0025B2B732|nr:glycine--tRNA ligase [Ferruginibacter paludis]MDN3658568.1 glycine--tRNA ligase [Ferruginibacter paludis]